MSKKLKIYVKNTLKINDKSFKVIAILEPTGNTEDDYRIFIPQKLLPILALMVQLENLFGGKNENKKRIHKRIN
jgi:hypothetical protein